MSDYRGKFKIDNDDLLDIIHPIGSIIMTVDIGFDPNDTWGGTWKQWKDGYLKVDTTPTQLNTQADDANTQGSYNISSSNLPKHTHTINHGHTFTGSSATTVSGGSSSKGISATGTVNLSHTHYYTPAGTISAEHTHTIGVDIDRTGDGALEGPNTNPGWADGNSWERTMPSGTANWDTNNPSFSGTRKQTESSGSSTQSISVSGSVDISHTHSFTAIGTVNPHNGSTGDGGFSNSDFKPKYYAVIAWQRIG